MGHYRKARRGRAGERRAKEATPPSDALARWREAEDDSPRTRRLLRLGGATEADASERLASKFFRRSPLVLYRGGSWRLSPNGSLKRWDAAVGRWESIRKGQWSIDEATVIDEHADNTTTEPADLVADDEVWSSVKGCTCVGGDLDDLCLYGKYTIVFGREVVTMLSHQAGVVEIPCTEVINVQIEGRGRVDDGDSGRERFAFGRGVDETAPASVVKSLVARAGMDTSIHIQTIKGESHFHCDCATPDEIRRPLGLFLAALPRGRDEQSAQHAELSGQLVKLTDLRMRGLLTEEEFESAVAAALEDQS